jgi:hypothetical protein
MVLVDVGIVDALVREGVLVMVGPGVRLGVCVRKVKPKGVAVFDPGFKMMMGSVALPAAVCIAEEGVFVLGTVVLETDPVPETPPC